MPFQSDPDFNPSFAEMMRVVQHGGLRGIVSRTFDLTEAAEAHKAMAGREVVWQAGLTGALTPLVRLELLVERTIRTEGGGEAAVGQPGFGVGVVLQRGFPKGRRTLPDQLLEHRIVGAASPQPCGTGTHPMVSVLQHQEILRCCLDVLTWETTLCRLGVTHRAIVPGAGQRQTRDGHRAESGIRVRVV